MQERQTSIGGVMYPLPRPFMVLATQNPIEEEGTYHLPRAQLDRFLLKEVISYPSPAEELEVLRRVNSGVLGIGAADPDRVVELDDVRFPSTSRHGCTSTRRSCATPSPSPRRLATLSP